MQQHLSACRNIRILGSKQGVSPYVCWSGFALSRLTISELCLGLRLLVSADGCLAEIFGLFSPTGFVGVFGDVTEVFSWSCLESGDTDFSASPFILGSLTGEAPSSVFVIFQQDQLESSLVS